MAGTKGHSAMEAVKGIADAAGIAGNRIKDLMKKNYPLYEVEPVNDLYTVLQEAAEKDPEGIVYCKQTTADGQPHQEIHCYGELLHGVQAMRLAMEKMGLQNAHVAIVGDDGFDSLTMLLAVLCGPGVLVSVSEELPADEILHILRASDTEAVFLAAKLLPKLGGKLGRLPGLRCCICPAENTGDRMYSYQSLLEMGEEALRNGALPEESPVGEEDPALLCFTAGTAKSGKGVMLTRKNLLFTLNGVQQMTAPVGSRLSLLPMPHPTEILCNLLPAICEHCAIVRCEGSRELLSVFRECKPESALLTPLLLETLYRGIRQTIEEQGKGNQLRQMLRASKQLRRAGIDRRSSFFTGIREVFGGRLRHILCIGTKLRPEVAEFFDAVGIPVLQGYGLPECGGVVTLQRDLLHDPESCGQPLPGSELKICSPDESGSGEILVRGDGVMIGYYNDRKATREALDAEGWLHTGDLGYLDEKNRLYVTGRKQNRILLKNGQTVYPEEIEEYLLEIPYVKETVVYASGADDGDEISLCTELYLSEETVSELSDADRLKLMKREIDDLNENLPSYKQLRKVRIRKTPFAKAEGDTAARTDLGQGEESTVSPDPEG